MYPHRIRLRGPWECEPLRRDDSDGPLPTPRRVTIPCRWSEAGIVEFTGRIRFRRRFGYPGNIDADERVWLTCVGLADHADVRLNETLLAERQTAPFEFEVTALLKPRNELILEVEGRAEAGGVWGEVALEVRCAAYLRGVHLRPVGDAVEVTGEVVGVSERPLELYVLLDHRQAGYETVAPTPEGRAFRLLARSSEANERPQSVQVDLVNGATVWYRGIWAISDTAEAGAPP